MERLRANDYVSITRKYLREYHLYTQYLNNARATLADIDRQLTTESIKTSKFGGEPGGGTSELNAIEAAASKRMELEEKRRAVCDEMFSVERIISYIRGSLPKLTSEKQALIRGFYFDNLPYKELAREHAYCEQWCRKLIRQAEREIAVMIFGAKASTDIGFINAAV